MQRFYFDIKLSEKLFLSDNSFFNQISHTLRSRVGDEIIIFNWDSYDYIYRITSISKKWIELELSDKIKNNSDSDLQIILYQAIPNKYEKIEYILQKWVEVGIREFNFYKAKRSSNLIINDKKIQRFEAIIKESLEQCGGNFIPKINFLDKINYTKIEWETIVCSTKGIESWKLKIENNPEIINIFVWPEWWFDDTELEEFEKNNFEFINFWSRILRTETVSSVLSFMIINGYK